jgi:hypothetical protein
MLEKTHGAADLISYRFFLPGQAGANRRTSLGWKVSGGNGADVIHGLRRCLDYY